MRKDILERKDEILKWIENKKTKSFICKELNCQEGTLNVWLKKIKVEYKGRSNWRKGIIILSKIPIEKYLQKNTYIGSNKLKQKLFDCGIKEKKCEKCKRTKWNRKEIPLQLHHKDGNKTNNELDNLQILCNNCHGQTDNYCKKSKKIKDIKINKNKICCCGKEISKKSIKCKSCVKLEQKRKVSDRPSLEILLKEYHDFGYEWTGRKYGVSGKCIKKWIIYYENRK